LRGYADEQMRPNPVIIRAYSLRGVRLWFGVRAIASLFIALAGGNALRLSPGEILNVVLLSVAVCFIDTWRNHERALLSNLAVTQLALVGLYALPAVLGELLLLAVGRLFT
jgi:hypothetical protein